jgi:hypothetical protein
MLVDSMGIARWASTRSVTCTAIPAALSRREGILLLRRVFDRIAKLWIYLFDKAHPSSLNACMFTPKRCPNHPERVTRKNMESGVFRAPRRSKLTQ